MVAGSALVAGGEPGTAVRLGLAMTALQASIGALNDLIDAPHDRGRKPGKPIPAGLVTPAAARTVVVGAAAVGILGFAASGVGAAALAVVVLGIGYGYDRFANGTAWSWLPFAVGIPLLPVAGWYGATGTLAPWFTTLLPMAALAGAALAVGNARADLERDRDAGTTTVATALGPGRSWWVLLGLWLVAAVIALVSAAGAGGSIGPMLAVAAGVVVVLAGAAMGRTGDPHRRERAWEVQAIGAAVTGVAWLIAAAA